MTSDALRIQDEILRRMSPADKLRVSEGMRATAWQLKAAWIRNRSPELSEAEVQDQVREIFLHAGE